MRIELKNICKAYNGKAVLKDLSLVFVPGEPAVIEGVSGIGKTTLIKIIEGLETPDSGEVLYDGVPNGKCRFAPVFQETRLIEDLNAVRNIRLAAPELSEDRIEDELKKLIPSSEFNKKVRDLSGGTRRRVETVRAVLAPSDVLIMDEPLTGLDEDNLRKVAAYIEAGIGDRIFIASSHSELLESFCRVIKL
ncbi:MAG: ATP-binding cassette domain-containing protein [Clostridiales bacterium]|nr:ATP-binding cassette domain-containing protein [Clostridiales bacterium]